jgi:hypothetical protein
VSYRRTAVRVWLASVVLASSVAAADDGALRVRELGPDRVEPWLHLDATVLDPTVGEGGKVDRTGVVLDVGRLRWAAEGMWWQSGLSPSVVTKDLTIHGWRAAAEVSYDLGPFRVGVNASLTREGDSRRVVGLFAYRTFRLSRWMRAWIVLGIAFEQLQADGLAKQGVTTGLSLGTTFR